MKNRIGELTKKAIYIGKKMQPKVINAKEKLTKIEGELKNMMP